MRTELLGQEKNIVKVKVEFEAGEFKTCLESTVREVAQSVSIPGFRKGHIPRRVIEMRVGKEYLYGKAVEKILPGAVEQIVADYDLKLIATPMFNGDTIEEGQPVTGQMTLEVVPEVNLPELGDIEVEKLRPVVSDELLEQTFQDIRKRNFTLQAVDRAAEESDVVSITSVTEGEAPQWDDVDLSGPTLNPKLKEALLGKSLGEEFVFESDVAPESDAPGRRERYDVTVTEVKEKVLPDMTPEFYKRALGIDLDSEEAFREELKKRLYERMDSESSNVASSMAVAKIVEQSAPEVPETLIVRQMEHQKKNDEADCLNRYKIGLDQFLSLSSVSPAQYEQQSREKAEKIMRRTLVLDEIADKFDISVEKEELEAEIDARAVAFQMEPAKLRAYYHNNKDVFSRVVDDVRYSKVFKLVLEKVSVKEVDGLTAQAAEEPESVVEPAVLEPTTEEPESVTESPIEETTAEREA